MPSDPNPVPDTKNFFLMHLQLDWKKNQYGSFCSGLQWGWERREKDLAADQVSLEKSLEQGLQITEHWEVIKPDMKMVFQKLM